jgi:hypothetical protein
MRSKPVYVAVSAAVLVAAVGVLITLARTSGSGSGEDPTVGPTSEPSGQLDGDELEEYWDDERMRDAEPPDMRE